MANRIPPVIREQVLALWLQAYSRDDIAKIVGIGSGTVSEIVNEYKRHNPGFGLLREFVVALRKEGTDIRKYGSTIRLQRLLETYDITEEQIESFIASVAVQCYKRKVDLKKFIEDVIVTADLASKTKVPIEELPAYIQEKERKLESLDMAVLSKKEEERELVQKCNAVQTQLEESRKQLVGVQEKQALRIENGNLVRENSNLTEALFSRERDLIWWKGDCVALAYAYLDLARKFSNMMSGTQDSRNRIELTKN